MTQRALHRRAASGARGPRRGVGGVCLALEGQRLSSVLQGAQGGTGDVGCPS